METPDIQNSHLNDQQKRRFRLWLQSEFSKRTRKNPRYSLRAFASALQMEPSSVSQILSGKRALSRHASLRICDKLAVSPKAMKSLGLHDHPQESDADFYQISMDQFAVIADWYHYAILEMTFLKDWDPAPKSIAKHLGIPIQEAKSALDRLTRLGLLTIDEGKVKKAAGHLTNHAGLNTSAAKKTLQRQVITKALESIDDVPQDFKDITSMTMAIDLKNFDRARDLIKQFRRDLCDLLEAGEPSQVYNIGIQLYPVSKFKENKK